MILELLRRDHAVRVLPIMLVAYGILGSMMARAQLERGPAIEPLDPRDLTVNLIFVLAWALINYFAVGKMHQIASAFEMSMPIDARTLWVARLIAMLATVCGGMAGFCIGFVLAYGAPITSSQAALAFNLVAFAALIPFLYTSARVHTPEWGVPLPLFVPLLLALSYVYLRSGLQTFLPGMIVIAATAVLATTTYARMPKAFELAPDKRSEAAGLEWLPLEHLDGVFGIGSFLDQARSLRPPAWFTPAQRRLLIVIVLLLNVLALSLSPFVLALVLVLGQFAWFVRTVNGGSRLAPLPISRDRVFWLATLPGLVAGAIPVAGLVAFLPELTWTLVFASRQAALGVALYAFAWWFTLSLLLDTLATPDATAGGQRWRRFPRVKYACAAGLALAFLALSTLERARTGEAPYPWEVSHGRAALLIMAEALPTSVTVLWMLALLCGVAAVVALRRKFLRVELVPATDF